LRKAGSVFQEPIMKLEITVPEDYWGNVIGDLMTRRAQIKETGNRGKLKTAIANVPLAEMFSYANALRSLTQGRASSLWSLLLYAGSKQHRRENHRLPSGICCKSQLISERKDHR